MKKHKFSISIPYRNIDRKTLKLLIKEFKHMNLPFHTNRANGRVYFNDLLKRSEKEMAIAIINYVIYKNSTLDYWLLKGGEK